ncbi:MAG: tyrosine-type recombinase/integrase [Armatimonadetes bacterium]|nr:tyrosine-type recombinase/integrase [Armatimonadota bacterium]
MWRLENEIRGLSPHTHALHEQVCSKLIWFLRENGCDSCGVNELRRFFLYLGQSHEARWGNSHPRSSGKMKAGSIATWHRCLRAFFAFLVREEMIPASPMHKIPRPECRQDQIQSFAPEQVLTLMDAAKGNRRNMAILSLLLDSGCRESELTALRVQDVDLSNRRMRVCGKGSKERFAFFGVQSAKLLSRYLGLRKAQPAEPLFPSERHPGKALTRNGLLQMVQALGAKAGIVGVRCSPHTFRHTFAVNFLRNGGNAFSLKLLLGHEDLKTTERYLALAQGDLADQHRAFSPMDRLLRTR